MFVFVHCSVPGSDLLLCLKKPLIVTDEAKMQMVDVQLKLLDKVNQWNEYMKLVNR